MECCIYSKKNGYMLVSAMLGHVNTFSAILSITLLLRAIYHLVHSVTERAKKIWRPRLGLAS